MYRYTFFILIMFFVTIGCSKKCVVCGDCPNDVTLSDESGNDVASVEVCESDFDSKEDYNAAIALTESIGCDCK